MNTEDVQDPGSGAHGGTADLVNPEPGVVTVWSDIGCPWASQTLHTLRAAIRRNREEVLIDHRVFPLELFNGRPTPKLLLDVELAAIAGAAPELGWLPWTAPDWSYPVTTLPAMEAVQAAKAPEVGGLCGSDQLDAALRRAWYVDSLCISTPGVILETAKACDLVDEDVLADRIARGAGRAEVYRQWDTAAGPEVRGSPHVFTRTEGVHNPGVSYRWTVSPGEGYLWVDGLDRSWADPLIASATGKA